MFTKEHYIAVAKVLGKAKRRVPLYKADTLICALLDDFIKLFKEDNKRFDKEEFCDVVYGKEIIE